MHLRWVNRKRLTVYSAAFAVSLLLLWLFWVTTGNGLLDRSGQPIGTDFITYYSASEIALEGDPAAVFDAERIGAVENRVSGANREVTEWHYPPTFLLAVLPLSLMPYLVALGLVMALGFVSLLVVVRRISADYLAVLLVVAFPGFFRNLTQGQNGFITAALLGGGLVLLNRRPVLGGMLLGLLTYKPHLALLVFLALLAARKLKALAAASASALTVSAAALLVLGHEPYFAFFDNIRHTTELLYAGQINLEKMHTVSSMLLLLGVKASVAQVLQVAASSAVALFVAWVWRSDCRSDLKYAGLSVGVVAAAPFLFDYDLVILALPLLWLAVDGQDRGWLDGEREMLAAVWALPFLASAVVGLTGVMITPLVLVVLMWTIVRRVRVQEVARADDSHERYSLAA